MKSPILGSSYVARSVNAADNRMVNMFPEIIPEGGKDPAFLTKREALRFYAFANGAASVSSAPIRGMLSTFDLAASGTPPVLYVVCGTKLYSTSDLITWTDRGTIDGTGSVSIASSGTQVFIATSAGSGYIVTIATNTLTQITDPDFPGSRQVAYLDGYFLFCTLTDQKVWCTNLLDGLSIEPLNFASAESFPDPVIGLMESNGDLWVFGTNTTEVWYNAGTAGFPFAPIQGANNSVGCISGFTVAKLGDSLMWLGQDSSGRGIVYKANGYRAQRISTHAIEWQIQNEYSIPGPPFYNSPTDEPWAFGYQLNGHLFYVLTIPGGNPGATWVYDLSTEAWHSRTDDSGFPYRARGFAFWSRGSTQIALTGDYLKNIIYYIAQGSYSDSDPSDPENAFVRIEWLRSWRALPTGQNNLKRTAHHSLQLDCETGVHDGQDPVTDPQVSLRFSDDGGHTWSTARAISMGASADYSKRVIWRRLGMTMKLRDRVYEVSGSDPVKVIINGAELLMSPTDA